MTIGERIKKARQEKHLTQRKLADIIGIKQNSVALLESGKRNPSEQTLLSICREFHVNETWLRTGEGEMFDNADTSILSQLASQYRLTKEQLSLIENFLTLPDRYREAVVQIAKHLANGQHAAPAPPAEPKAYTDEELAIYEKVRAVKEKERGMSSGSTIGESA